jgi:hypothetical protein
MPAVSPKQYGLMQMKAHGGGTKGIGPSPQVAKEFINKTPKKKRSQFAKAIAKNKY